MIRSVGQSLLLAFVATCTASSIASGLIPEENSDKSKLQLESCEFFEGFFDFYWDDAEGKIWLQLAEPGAQIDGQPFLYVSSLSTGLGSNPVGLDRGQLGADRIVRFKRVGKRVYLIQENWKYRAETENQLEQRAVRESFAESILWSGEVKQADVGSVVELNSFLMRDAHDCVGKLSETGQGSFSLKQDRSFIHLPRCKAFPRNSEFEATLTFASSKPGRLANRVAADGKSVTLRQHHSFVQLPEPGYTPRKWDPRVGSFALNYSDYASPIEEPLEKRLITRHRLEKTDANAKSSPVKEPIVYYLDPGVPEPVRSALLDGARWWSVAFEAAGFEDAFQVKILPADADPMDVRFNMIQWVHRATRGWSYGQSFVDPRTGEIIKGHVLLGSLRVRQDHLLFEGLGHKTAEANLSPNNAHRACSCASTCGMGSIPSEAYLSALDPNVSSTEVALARIRQLSAHEVGHTLGFAHNFAASTYADRASVMDYPAPRAKITDGKIDLSDAYGVGIGEWDKFTVQYAYSQFPAANEEQELKEIIQGAITKGLRYITDADARPAGAAEPYGNLWDNGSDPVAALAHELAVREIAIRNFSAEALHPDQPLSDLEKAFVPIYLHHRYQIDATAKALGGYRYNYAFPSDGQTTVVPIDTEVQRGALAMLMRSLDPSQLEIPNRILELIPPKAVSSVNDQERFGAQTAPLFDRGMAAQTAIEMTLGQILQPQRCSRLAQAGQDSLGLAAVLLQIRVRVLGPQPDASEAAREITRITERVFVDRLMDLAKSSRASSDAKNIARNELRMLISNFQQWSRLNGDKSSLEVLQWSALTSEINRFLQRPFPTAESNSSVELPPGSPIGQ
ncbi:MAG: zinc-dependent metalloprotease [Planctomycetota bacterium]